MVVVILLASQAYGAPVDEHAEPHILPCLQRGGVAVMTMYFTPAQIRQALAQPGNQLRNYSQTEQMQDISLTLPQNGRKVVLWVIYEFLILIPGSPRIRNRRYIG